jgi:hypothetical protein
VAAWGGADVGVHAVVLRDLRVDPEQDRRRLGRQVGPIPGEALLGRQQKLPAHLHRIGLVVERRHGHVREAVAVIVHH